MRVCVCVSVSVRVGDCGCRCVDDVVICSSRRGARCVTALPWCFVCCVLPLTCTAHVCHPPSAPLPLPLQDDICGLIDKCTENEVLTSAEAMVSSGMHSLGYEWIWLGPSVMTVSVILSHSVSFCLSLSLFVSLSLSLSLSLILSLCCVWAAAASSFRRTDDCWADTARDSQNRLQANPKQFPNGMKPVADKLHSLGLKLGLYTCIGVAPRAPQRRPLPCTDAIRILFAPQGRKRVTVAAQEASGTTTSTHRRLPHGASTKSSVTTATNRPGSRTLSCTPISVTPSTPQGALSCFRCANGATKT